MTRNDIHGILGYDIDGYSRRASGHSPEPIRDAVWALTGADLAGTVVDIGAGGGGWTARLLSSGRCERVIAVDLVDSGASAIAGVEFQQRDLSVSALDVPEGSVDWIFAIEVIEHLANPRHFVSEAARCLSKGGRLVVTTPCNESLTSKLSFCFRGYFPAFCDHDYMNSGHITPITELDLRRMTREAGLSRLEFHWPLPGRIPRSSVSWQRLFPWLSGKLWSDCLLAIVEK